MGATKMERILQHDQAVAKRFKQQGRKEGLTRKVHVKAIMDAVKHEGNYIMTSDGKGYWNDMQRRYPHLNLLDRPVDTGENLSGTRNHFGRVSMTYCASLGWRKNVGGRLVPCDKDGNPRRDEPRARARHSQAI